MDTHVFLWWTTDDRRLSSRARMALEDGTDEIFFSAVSAWEIAIKARLGHIDFVGDVEQEIPEHIAFNAFRILPVEVRHGLRVARLPLLHRDPFDRLLVAQAQIESLSILTNDPAISRYDVQAVW